MIINFSISELPERITCKFMFPIFLRDDFGLFYGDIREKILSCLVFCCCKRQIWELCVFLCVSNELFCYRTCLR